MSLSVQSFSLGETHWQSFFPAKYIIAQLSDVISISTRVSLQWFKLNRKKSATKLIHCVSARNVLEVFVAKSFTVAHEVEAVVIVSHDQSASQPDENRSKTDGIQHMKRGKRQD